MASAVRFLAKLFLMYYGQTLGWSQQEAAQLVVSKKFNLRPAPSGRTPQEVVADMRAAGGLPPRADGTGRRQEIVQEARAARAAPAYQPRRVVQPATAEAAREERTRAYVEARVNRHNATRGFGKPL